jgi:hypothetical protein
MDYQVLIGKIATIVNMPEKEEGLSLSDAILFLDKYVSENQSSLPGKLSHYLVKRSYVKAYNFIIHGEEG